MNPTVNWGVIACQVPLKTHRATGKKYDMGKSCVRFKKLDDLPLDLIVETIASASVDDDVALERAVEERRYQRKPSADRPMSRLAIPRPFPAIDLPPGFRLSSLAEDNDLDQVDRVLWRGFNHTGAPPPESRQSRLRMQSGPNDRLDLTVVVVAPGGEFVSYSGAWYDPANRIAYVEPVATDPDYRRQGLGTAAVLESVRRAGELGATCAYVGTDMPFYLSMGFERLHTLRCFERTWRAP